MGGQWRAERGGQDKPPSRQQGQNLPLRGERLSPSPGEPLHLATTVCYGTELSPLGEGGLTANIQLGSGRAGLAPRPRDAAPRRPLARCDLEAVG